MISYNHSKRILKKAIIKIKDEKIKSINSLNRTVSKDIYSTINYPSGDNAAFDGYAINSNDTKNIKKNSPQKFKIIGLIAAGNRPLKKKIKKFDAAEIMTGGIVPKGFNTIIPIEQIVFFTPLTDLFRVGVNEHGRLAAMIMVTGLTHCYIF